MSHKFNLLLASAFCILALGLVLWLANGYRRTHNGIETSSDSSGKNIVKSSNAGSLKTGVDPTRMAAKGNRGIFQPIDPVSAAEKMQPVDVDLVDWLREWKKSPESSAASPEQSQRLVAILARTALKSEFLFDISHDFHHAYNKCEDVVAQMYRCAVLRAHEELIDPNSTPASRKLIIDGYLRHREDFKHSLWPVINETRDSTDIDTICTMYHDILTFYDKKDKHVASIAQSVEIGYAECLSLQGRFDETLKQIELTDQEDLSGERRASLEWIWGLTLSRLHRDEDALEHLEIVAESPKSEFVGTASLMVVQIQCGKKDLIAASSVRNKYQAMPSCDSTILGSMDSLIARVTSAP